MGSIDEGDNLVSTSSLSQNFDPLDWRPGPVKFGHKTKNTPLNETLAGEPLTQINNFF